MANEVKKSAVKVDTTNTMVGFNSFKALTFEEFTKMVGEFSKYSVKEQQVAFAAMGTIGLQVEEKVSSQWSQLNDAVLNMKDDYTAFTEKGNQAAGTRIREAILKLKTFTTPFRKAIQAGKQKIKAAKASKRAKQTVKAEAAA